MEESRTGRGHLPEIMMNEASKELRRQKADAVLHTHYHSKGLEYCTKISGIHRDYLRWRVQKLELRVSAEVMSNIRKEAAKKERVPRADKSKHRPPVRTPARANDVKLTRLEKIALGIKT